MDQHVTEIGATRQLFVDDQGIGERAGVTWQLHQLRKHPDNPVVAVDRPWEAGGVSLYGSVWRDYEAGLLRMWYRAGNRAGKEDWRNASVVCQAVSVD